MKIKFVSLETIAPAEITAHMSDPRMAEHMPLLVGDWDDEKTRAFLAGKAECWRRDGLGHWAILIDGAYAGWGGFQKEGDEWDFGLVLRPDFFGAGISIASKALEHAKNDHRISYITFLLPRSRKHLGGLRKFRLDTI